MAVFNLIPNPVRSFDTFGHLPHVTTNEQRTDVTLDILRNNPITGNTVFGVSCFFTLDAAAVRGTKCLKSERSIERIVIFDRGVRVEHFWNKAEEIIKTSDNRLDVIDRIHTLLENNSQRYFGGSSFLVEDGLEITCAAFNHTIDQNLSWLSDDTRFTVIKEIFDRNHFIFKRVDLFDPAATKVFSELMKEENMTLDTAYLSNINEYCKTDEDDENYVEAINQILLQEETLVISAHFPDETPGAAGYSSQYVQKRSKIPTLDLLFPTQESLEERALRPI